MGGLMSFSKDIGDEQPGDRHTEEILQQISFIQIRDSECGVVGWRYKKNTPGLSLVSIRLFDSFQECFEKWQRSHRNPDDQDYTERGN